MYTSEKDKLLKDLGTVKDPDETSELQVSLRVYATGQPKIAINRLLGGKFIKLGRLTLKEAAGLVALITAVECDDDTIPTT